VREGKKCVEELHAVNVESQPGRVVVNTLKWPSKECQNKIVAKGMQMTQKSQDSLARSSAKSNSPSEIFSGL
jgi:glycerol-3-phosphate responsive antiterminator